MLGFTVATLVVALDQTPPAGEPDKVVVVFVEHIYFVPVIAETTGIPLTVTVVFTVVLQLFPSVTWYEITEPPGDTPVTTPLLLMLATVVLLLLQTPGTVESDKVVVALTQTFVVPVIGATTGFGFTVRVNVEELVQPFPSLKV